MQLQFNTFFFQLHKPLKLNRHPDVVITFESKQLV